jgi:hypothetical protein
MAILRPGARPSDGRLSQKFLLEPLGPEHLEADYEAVMESRERLRHWSLSTWPEDDFTLRGDLDDLERHAQEHRNDLAYTYTVLSPDRRTCLGCVYIKDLSPVLRAEAFPLADAPGMRVFLWVRESARIEGLEMDLLRDLIAWFRAEWDTGQVFFTTASPDIDQIALFREAGLLHRFTYPVECGTYEGFSTGLDGAVTAD